MHFSNSEENSICLITLLLVCGLWNWEAQVTMLVICINKIWGTWHEFGQKTISISFLRPTLFSKLVCNCDQLVSIWPFYNSWYLRWNLKGHSSSWVHPLRISILFLTTTFFTYSWFPWTLRIAKVCHGQYAGHGQKQQQHQGPFLRRCRDKLMGRVNPCHTATPHPKHKIQLNFVKALPLLLWEERGFETFDGGNKGLGGGSGELGKKWNVFLACCHQSPSGIGVG